jgi:hypothetical protein
MREPVDIGEQPANLIVGAGQANPHIHRLYRLIVLALLVFCVAKIVIVMQAASTVLPIGGDARAYLAAARALQAGHDPSDADIGRFLPEADSEVPRYFYPPFLALVIMPLASIPYMLGLTLWMILVLATTLALIPLLRPLVGWPIAIIGVLFFLPTWESLWLGQINAAVAISTTITLLAVPRKQDVGAGVALTIGTLLKITPGLFIPILVMQRRWRTFVAAVITGLLAVLLSLPAVPIAMWWSGSLLALTSNWTSPLLLSWTAMLRQIGGALGTFGPPALGIAMIAMTLWRSRTITLQNALTAMILLPLLISGIVWHYTAIVALPAFAVLWQQGRQARLLAAISWVAITLVGGPLQPFMLSLCWVISCWPQLLARHHEQLTS